MSTKVRWSNGSLPWHAVGFWIGCEKSQRLNKVQEALSAGKEIEFPTASVDPIEAIEIDERRHQVVTALNQIPPLQRQVIEMAYYQGLTHTEIAAATGLSLGTVKTRLRLGLSKLRVAFESGSSVVDRQY